MGNMETAYFAGGCFWCISPTFRNMPGVKAVISGYSGGSEEDPVYEDVKHQRTGHRETIQIDFDPAQVSYNDLFDVFLGSVDPYDPDGQFVDRGFSYTLAAYYLSEAQETMAREKIRSLEQAAGKPVYIRVEPFRSFWRAEEYHQNFDLKNPEALRRELIESGRVK